jgi:hypothetical protein
MTPGSQPASLPIPGILGSLPQHAIAWGYLHFSACSVTQVNVMPPVDYVNLPLQIEDLNNLLFRLLLKKQTQLSSLFSYAPSPILGHFIKKKKSHMHLTSFMWDFAHMDWKRTICLTDNKSVSNCSPTRSIHGKITTFRILT